MNGENLTGLTTESLNCVHHKFQFYSRYCFKDEKPICELCAEKEPIDKSNLDPKAEPPEGGYGHKGHQMKPLEELTQKLLKEK